MDIQIIIKSEDIMLAVILSVAVYSFFKAFGGGFSK
jgi:hypothetical protein